jgi:hypothetical protein
MNAGGSLRVSVIAGASDTATSRLRTRSDRAAAELPGVGTLAEMDALLSSMVSAVCVCVCVCVWWGK